MCRKGRSRHCIGTLGVVLRSKKNRQIERARPLVEELVAADMFLDDEFADRVLTSVEELKIPEGDRKAAHRVYRSPAMPSGVRVGVLRSPF